MDIKKLIKEKQLKTIKANKRRDNGKKTTKVNNVPCDYSPYVIINPDRISHINLKDKKRCKTACSDHPCTFLCPSHVYGWTIKGIQIDYQKCIECGACNIFCPSGNIQWSYPRSGYGIHRRY